VIGKKSFEKRVIYQALTVLDNDGNKKISFEEFISFIYKVWKTQLNDLNQKLLDFHDDNNEKHVKYVTEILTEKKSVKEAIKKNFPRHWRDKIEQQNNGHDLPGPFHSLLKRLNMLDTSINNNNVDNIINASRIDDEFNLNSPNKQINNINIENSNSNNFTLSSPPNTTKPSSKNSYGNIGKNSMMRFKIKLKNSGNDENILSNRPGAVLTVPSVKNIGADKNELLSGELSKKLLTDH
jgi:hypothetical protein